MSVDNSSSKEKLEQKLGEALGLEMAIGEDKPTT